MSCEEVQTQLTALLDGELAPEMTAEIEAHLAGCAACSEARAEMEAVLEMTRAWSVEGAGVLAAVQQQIQQDEMRALLQEVRQLRNEVASLREEVAHLKGRAGKSARAADREASVLRFPYASVRDIPRPVL
jgi:anti-sigma factor RsiW